MLLPATRVSLQGREERQFSASVRLLAECGVPIQRQQSEAWSAFQNWRVEYAPHATLICSRLLHEEID